jgi:nitrate reductase NapE component
MLERLIQSFTLEKGWGSLLATLFELECQHVAKRIENFRKKIFMFLCIFAFGFVCIALGLIGFSVWVIQTCGTEHLIESLAALSFFFACIGVFFIRKALLLFS